MTFTSRRKIVTLLTFSLILLSACAQKPVEIGFIAGFTGPNSNMGVAAYNALVIAVDDINEMGGVGGRPVQIRDMDDRGSGLTALSMLSQFHQKGVDYFIGPMTSQIMMSLYPYLQENDILMVSPTVSRDSLSAIDDNLIKSIPDNKQTAESMADFILSMGYKKVAVLYDGENIAYSQREFENFQRFIEVKGGSVTGSFFFDPFELDATEPILLELLGTKPDAMFFISNSFSGAFLCQQLYKHGIDIPVFFPSYAMSSELLHLGGVAVEGAFSQNVWDIEGSNIEYINFKNKYIDRYGIPPTYSSLQTYESLLLLVTGMRKADEIFPENVKDHIIKLGTFYGLQGEFSINQYGDSMKSFYNYQVQDGAFVKIGD